MSEKDVTYYINQADQYLDGQLDNMERQEFENVLQGNTDLRQAIKKHVIARSVINQQGEQELKLTFKKAFENDKKVPTSNQSKSTHSKLPYLLTFLLGLGLLIYGLLHWGDAFSSDDSREKNSPMLIAEIQDPTYELFRSDATLDSLSTLWNEAIISFSQRNYEEALKKITLIETDSVYVDNNRGKLSLLKGVSLLHLESYEQSLTTLGKISSTNPYYDQSLWYSSLVHYFKEDYSTARTTLESILQDPDHYKSQEAERLLDSFKD